MSDSYKFKKRGNEEQHKHNQKVFIKMREASGQLDSDNLTQDNISAAKRKISEGMDLMKNRFRFSSVKAFGHSRLQCPFSIQ
jgi:hypothetical protein